MTLALANGKTDDWVRARTLHAGECLRRYRRMAQSVSELNLGTRSPLEDDEETGLPLAWQGELQVRSRCEADGRLLLDSVRYSAWQGIRVPRMQAKSPDEVVGFFAAVASVPGHVPPNVWLVEALDPEDFAGENQFAEVVNLCIRKYNELNDRLSAGDASFCPPADDEEAVEAFCHGFDDGAHLDEEVVEDLDSPANTLLDAIALLAGETSFEDVGIEVGDEEAWLVEQRQKLPELVLEIHRLWGARRQFAAQTSAPKVGRNEALS